MINTILFDADGMIITQHQYFSERLIQEFNLNPLIVYRFFQTEWPQIVVGKADLKQQIKPYLKTWNLPHSTQELLDYWFQFESTVDQQIVSLISQLKSQGIMCCLATNQEKYRLNYFKSQLQFEQLFDKIFSSCDLGYKKPDQNFFKSVWEKLNQPPKNTLLFWDDKLANVNAAKKFGINAQQYQSYPQFVHHLQNKYHLLAP